MKTWIIFAFTLCGLNSATAAEFSATGIVQKVFALDTVTYGVEASHILVNGFASAGSCLRNDGLVALALRNDDGGKRQLAVALSAKLAGLPVVVRADDTFKNSAGSCYLAYLELN